MGQALGVCNLAAVFREPSACGAELIDQKLKSYLLQAIGTTVTWSSTDTAISECKFQTLGEITLAMLADSGLPKSFWWVAFMCRMMPTRTF